MKEGNIWVRRLISDQAIEHTPNAGIRVPAISKEDFLEITAIREALTQLAADLAVERMSDEEINAVNRRDPFSQRIACHRRM